MKFLLLPETSLFLLTLHIIIDLFYRIPTLLIIIFIFFTEFLSLVQQWGLCCYSFKDEMVVKMQFNFYTHL